MSSLRAPWIKRIDLHSGAASVLSLDPGEPLEVVARTQGRRTAVDRFEFDGHSWYLVEHRWPRSLVDDSDEDGADPGPPSTERCWAIHGTTSTGASVLFSFMEFPEARNPQLESTLATDERAVLVYADWLEEQGDPYAAALNPQLLKERGPAGRWFLEGLDRSGLIEFTLRGALVREVKLGAVPEAELAAVLHRLCHLRACVALEHVSMARPANVTARMGRGVPASARLWRTCQWPKSLRRLTVSGDGAEVAALSGELGIAVRRL